MPINTSTPPNLDPSEIEKFNALADQPRIAAGLPQGVGPVLLGVAEWCVVVDRARRAQVAAGVDTHPARTAGRRLVKAVAEMRALARQLVEVGCLHDLVAGYAQTVGAKLVGEDEEYVARTRQ